MSDEFVTVIYQGAHDETHIEHPALAEAINGIVPGVPVELPAWLVDGHPGEPGIYIDAESGEPKTFTRLDLLSEGQFPFGVPGEIMQQPIDEIPPLPTGDGTPWRLATDPPPTDSVPDAGVYEVNEWVGDDPERAREAIAAEHAGKNRKGVIDAAEAVIAAADTEDGAQ